MLVTDHGIAVNPARPEIRERLMEAGMKVVDINALYERAISLTGVPKPIEFTDKIVGVIPLPRRQRDRHCATGEGGSMTFATPVRAGVSPGGTVGGERAPRSPPRLTGLRTINNR